MDPPRYYYPSIVDQNFGMCISPQDLIYPIYNAHHLNYYRPWQLNMQKITKEFKSTIHNEKDAFTITLDVHNFKQSELNVKVSDNEVIIEGNHEERKELYGFISRQFKRRYILPKDCNPDSVVSSLTSDGVLVVSANKNIEQNIKETIVPIKIYGKYLKQEGIDSQFEALQAVKLTKKVDVAESNKIDIEERKKVVIEESKKANIKEGENIEDRKKVDFEESKKADIKEGKKIDIKERKTVDIEQSKKAAIEQSEKVDIAQSKTVDIEQRKKMGFAQDVIEQSKKMDIAQTKTGDMEQSKNNSIEQSKQVDIAQSKKVDIEKSNDIGQSKKNYIEQSEKVDIAPNKKVDIEQSMGIGQIKKVDIEQGKKVDIAQSKKVDIGQSKKMDIGQSKKLDTAQSKRDDIESKKKTKLTSREDHSCLLKPELLGAAAAALETENISSQTKKDIGKTTNKNSEKADQIIEGKTKEKLDKSKEASNAAMLEMMGNVVEACTSKSDQSSIKGFSSETFEVQQSSSTYSSSMSSSIKERTEKINELVSDISAQLKEAAENI